MAWLGVFILCVIFVRCSVCCPNGCSCSPVRFCTGTYVNCSSRGLTTVPTNLPNDTCVLDLDLNAITTVRKGSFEGLANLIYLYLHNNKITMVEKGSFGGLTNLQGLWLYNNMITMVEKGIFGGLTNLQELWLFNNKITMVEKGSFGGLANLQALYLRYNLLRKVNKDLVDGLSKLKYFYLNGNPLDCDCDLVAFLTVARTRSLTLKRYTEPRCHTPRKLNGTLLKDLPLQDMTKNCALTTTAAAVHTDAVSTTVTLSSTCDCPTGTSGSTKDNSGEQDPVKDFTESTIPGDVVRTNNDAPVDKASSEEKEGLSVIAVAYIITVPLLICVSIAVNFVCYKCGFKKGKTAERKHQLQQFLDDTQTVHYQHYQGDDENVQRAAREQPGPSAGQVSTDASHDYAAYDEIKEQRQRIQTSQRKKDGGYLTPVSQNVNRSLPAVRTDGDGYMSPASATDNRPAGQGKRNSPSPPGNGGYISPLQAENVAERLVSSNSDSSSNKSDKSDKSRKYQNEPRSKPSPTSKSIYQSIKDTGITPEHQYIELKTSAS